MENIISRKQTYITINFSFGKREYSVFVGDLLKDSHILCVCCVRRCKTMWTTIAQMTRSTLLGAKYGILVRTITVKKQHHIVKQKN